MYLTRFSFYNFNLTLDLFQKSFYRLVYLVIAASILFVFLMVKVNKFFLLLIQFLTLRYSKFGFVSIPSIYPNVQGGVIGNQQILSISHGSNKRLENGIQREEDEFEVMNNLV